MSAYVVNDETINRVISYIALSRDLRWMRQEIERKTNCNLELPEGQKELAESMFALNCNAVDQRYGEGEAASFRPLNFRYQRMSCSVMQAYKDLGTWLYQCTEGDVPDTPLYAAMKELHADMAHALVRRMPEYNR